MENKVSKNKKSLIIYTVISVIVLLSVVIAITYAYYNFDPEKPSTLVNVSSSLECIDLVLSDNNTSIGLSNNYPVTDEYVKENNLTPLTVTVTNNCSTPKQYTLALSTIAKTSDIDNYIYDSKIRYRVDKNNENYKGYDYLSNLTRISDTSKLYTNLAGVGGEISTKYPDYTLKDIYSIDDLITIDSNTSNIYDIYLWVDYYEGDYKMYTNSDIEHNEVYDGSTENKKFAAAISLTLNTGEKNEEAPIYAIYDIGTCFFENEGECQIYHNTSLAFYQNYDEVNVGDTYDGYKVTEVYRNLNNTNYTSIEDVPWKTKSSDNPGEIKLIIEEPIKPKNTSYWFINLNDYVTLDLNNLDTSNVTNMSHMFDSNETTIRGNINLNLSHFDTTKVADMSYMFTGLGRSSLTLDLSGWDTSNVTDMSYMFAPKSDAQDMLTVDLSTWNTSKVTNMSHMFAGAGEYSFSIGNITRREVTATGKTYIAWDTSKVTNMESMFENAGIETTYSLNLSSWQVPLVTNHTNFGDSSKITPPNWVN